jgi:hypothetical protein
MYGHEPGKPLTAGDMLPDPGANLFVLYGEGTAARAGEGAFSGTLTSRIRSGVEAALTVLGEGLRERVWELRDRPQHRGVTRSTSVRLRPLAPAAVVAVAVAVVILAVMALGGNGKGGPAAHPERPARTTKASGEPVRVEEPTPTEIHARDQTLGRESQARRQALRAHAGSAVPDRARRRRRNPPRGGGVTPRPAAPRIPAAPAPAREVPTTAPPAPAPPATPAPPTNATPPVIETPRSVTPVRPPAGEFGFER